MQKRPSDFNELRSQSSSGFLNSRRVVNTSSPLGQVSKQERRTTLQRDRENDAGKVLIPAGS
jgi:hypothetical protein